MVGNLVMVCGVVPAIPSTPATASTSTSLMMKLASSGAVRKMRHDIVWVETGITWSQRSNATIASLLT
jgi:hypothetical protein